MGRGDDLLATGNTQDLDTDTLSDDDLKALEKAMDAGFSGEPTPMTDAGADDAAGDGSRDGSGEQQPGADAGDEQVDGPLNLTETDEGHGPATAGKEGNDDAGAEDRGTRKTDDPGKTGASADDPLAQFREEVSQRMRKIEGTQGEIKDRLQKLVDGAIGQAARAAGQQGADTPSKEQIAELKVDSEKLKNLKQDFPEFAEALEEALKDTYQQIAQAVGKRSGSGEPTGAKPQFDADMLDEVINDRLERFELRLAHKDFAEVIKSKPFEEWVYADGPTETERAALRALEQKAMDQSAPRAQRARAEADANAMLNEHIRKYPNWWSEKGALMDSPKSADAIKLLDAYKQREQAPAGSEKGTTRGTTQERLESAVPATRGGRTRSGSRGGRRDPSSEEQSALEAGFREG